LTFSLIYSAKALTIAEYQQIDKYLFGKLRGNQSGEIAHFSNSGFFCLKFEIIRIEMNIKRKRKDSI